MSGFDVAVVGAGPAGVAAALAAAQAGARTVIIDEQDEAGGQVYRAPSPALPPADGPGRAMREGLAASGVTRALGRRLWFAEPGFSLHLIGERQPIAARVLILATGAQERVAPVPGWTLPGVIGLAAATALIKGQGVVPGQRVVVSGRGPLLLLVASLLIEHGASVAAIVDRAPRSAWFARPLSIATRPDLALQGARWLATVLRQRVPIHSASVVRRIIGAEQVSAVEIVPLADPERTPLTIACDAVCHGDGLAPATEISRSLGATHCFDAGLGGWHVATDDHGGTDVPGLFACGDGAGVLGAAAAPLRGRRAGLAAARSLGLATADRPPEVQRAARFGAAMSGLAPADGSHIAFADAGTTICRCESVTRGALEDAIDAGVRTPNALKATTRCGMGACGGRVCGDAMAAVLAARTGRSLADVGMTTGRPPLRPLPIEELTAGFDYASIPFPEPAPL